MDVRRRLVRWLPAVACSVAAAFVTAPAATAHSGGGLTWKDCSQLPDQVVQCATQTVPLDYDRPSGKTIDIAMARVPAKDQAHRIGALFFNFGGPGGTQVDYLQTAPQNDPSQWIFGALNQRFDIVGFDPRGVGQSSPSIDCKVNQETQGPNSQPFPTPFNLDVQGLLRKDLAYLRRCAQLNGEILSHVSTADVARDMDVMRKSVGDDKLSYLGYSYGTFLGTTYASLFPNKFRALVLDGPIDADEYLSDPLKGSNEQTAAFERELGRFFAACAGNQAACLGFGADPEAGQPDPEAAYDDLVEQANANPIPAPRYTPDPRPVDGDDINAVAIVVMYNKGNWPILAQALAEAQQGDGSLFRLLVDEAFYGRDPDTGEFDPGLDRFFAIYGAEARWPKNISVYLREGDQAWGMFNHFYFNHGYTEINFGLWPAKAQDAYYGPFQVKDSAPTPLVVATRYDPATPYRGALRLVHELGNARLITMRGDGHTAYPGNSQCIDQAVEAYLIDLTLPAPGTVCRQQVPFAQPEARTTARAKQAVRRGGWALHQKQLGLVP
jgi:pimeloyl-ACP methyl ester carboxylesterase